MDRRTFRTTKDKLTMKTKKDPAPKLPLDEASVAPTIPDVGQLVALRELGNQLQIKAEKMRLLARAEEGLGDGEMNPYTTHARPIETILQMEKKDVEATKQENEPIEHKAPPTAARRRRRDKKTRPPGAPATNVDIKHYRPGYTWNRGGRVKELRIRTVARKFLHIWKKKVFGRVTPSQARQHYRRRLVRVTFRAWHGVWWELRKEWRLEVRAECHHRYVLWLKTFRAWRDFIVKQRIKNTKKALAHQHASCKLEKKIFDGWLAYTHERRSVRADKRAADGHYDNTLMRRCWRQWEDQHELVLHRRHMETVALQFWAYRMQAQHWLMWQAKVSGRKASIQRQFRAVRHHNTAIVTRCLKAWLAYWAHRRQKKQEKEYALKIHQLHTLRKAFVSWHDSYRRQQAILEQQHQIVSLAETFQKRRMFMQWRHYIALVHDKQEKWDLAEAHYERKLKVAGFSAFRLSVVQCKVKAMRHVLAEELRVKQLTRGAWTCWLTRCENNEEVKIIAHSQKAKKHYRRVLLGKCFDQLQQYRDWRQYRQAQYAKADAHFYMRVMPECMFRLKVFVQLMKNNRENAEKAVDFRRENVQARFFYQWVNQYEFSKEYRMNERMAILHNEDTTKKAFFLCWKTRTAEVLQEAEHKEVAAEHYNEVLCRNHFQAWLCYIRDIHKSQRQYIEASVHHHKTTMKTCFHAWLAYTRRRRVQNGKTERARRHYGRTLCRKMVAMWLHYVDMQRSVRHRVELMYTRKCYQNMGEAFSTWRANVAEQIQARQAYQAAIIHHRHHAMAKVFKAWHRFAAIHAYKKSETRQWVVSARDHLNHRVLDVYFTKWLTHHREHVEMRQKLQLAADHHGNKVKQKVMQGWKAFTQESIRLSLLEQQSSWFLRVRVTARCFLTWKARLGESQLEREKTHLALWSWCLGLQRKVFLAWLSYIEQRRVQKSRISAAMERRRGRLLKTGLTQWLTVADDMAGMRKTFAAQQQAKCAYETSQLVLRAGLHWKHWAARQRQQRGAPKPALPLTDMGAHSSQPHSAFGGHSSQPHSARGGYSSQPHSARGGYSSQPHSARGGHSATTTSRTAVSTNVTPREVGDPLKVTPTEAVVTPRDLSVIPRPVVVASPGHIAPVSHGEPRRPQLRARPRKPDFLVESLKRAGLYSPASHRYEEPDQQTEDKLEGVVSAKEVGNAVERLNLTHLNTDRSDKTNNSSVPFKVYTDTGAESGASTFRSQHQQPHNAHEREPVQTLDTQPVQMIDTKPVHTDLPPGGGGMGVGQGREQWNDVDREFQSLSAFQTCAVPKQQNKFQLMTPADFLQKKDQTYSLPAPIAYTDFNHPDSKIHSECQSTATTPRILCHTAGHSHPLSETRSFRVGEFSAAGEITPRSVSSLVTLPDSSRSQGKQPRAASTNSVQKEIVVIRNRLKSFDQKKKKLRTMQKQLKQLSDWLTDLEVKGHRSDDEDVVTTKQEVTELSADVDALRHCVEEEKGQCAGLVDRVKLLMSQLPAT